MPETTTASRKPRRGEKVKTTTGGARRLACDANGPQVSIIMGSDSDWPTMEPAAQVLTDFNVGFEADVVSAHRMPEDMIEFTRADEEGERRLSPHDLLSRRTASKRARLSHASSATAARYSSSLTI